MLRQPIPIEEMNQNPKRFEVQSDPSEDRFDLMDEIKDILGEYDYLKSDEQIEKDRQKYEQELKESAA